jgi:transcriptional regulator with XRE-family HTH domain
MIRRALTPEEREDAKRLKQIWNERKENLLLSQVKAADKMGFASQAAISQYLNAKLPLNMETVAKFAQVLHANVKDISPRYAEMVGTPAPSSLNGYTAPQTGSIGGVPTEGCLDWFAFSKGFLEAVGSESIKLFRVENHKGGDLVVIVDDSPHKITESGTFLLLEDDRIVMRKIVLAGDQVVIEGTKKVTIPKEAVKMIKILGRVLAAYTNL